MIWIFLCAFVLIAAVIQIVLTQKSKEHIFYDYSFDEELVEPGQKITFRSRVKNVWSFPVFYVRLLEYFPAEIKILESEERIKRTFRKDFATVRSNCAFYLLPHTVFETQFSFSIPARGVFRAEKFYVETGDYLGLRTLMKTFEMKKEIVVMPKRCESVLLRDALGGYLGEISVRRFLMEDPILTVGFHDYTGTEPMKNISWTETAKVGRIQVKEFDHTVEHTVSLLLNFEGGSEEELECCYEITRTVCEALEEKHIPYEFFTNGDVPGPVSKISWLSSGLGKTHYNAIMYGLGRTHGFCYEKMTSLAASAVKRRRNNSGYILVTPSVNAKNRPALDLLRRYSDHDICVLSAREIIDAEREEAAS